VSLDGVWRRKDSSEKGKNVQRFFSVLFTMQKKSRDAFKGGVWGLRVLVLDVLLGGGTFPDFFAGGGGEILSR